jgi:hypothetical protein
LVLVLLMMVMMISGSLISNDPRSGLCISTLETAKRAESTPVLHLTHLQTPEQYTNRATHW